MMNTPLKLMCILAHPDDESLGVGGTLAKYAAAGVETHLLMATRGERGWFGDPAADPGPTALGAIRTQELQAAAAMLGLHSVHFLDYLDGDLDQAAAGEIISRIVTHLRHIRPQVVITFDPQGAYGHPDHIAISQFTTAAVMAAASPETVALGPPHQVAKLYYLVATQAELAAYQEIFGELVMTIDGVARRATGWEPWSITTRIDTAAYWRQVWQAIACHRSQLPGYQTLQELPAAAQQQLWATQTFYRVFSLVNGGRTVETDLFAGLDQENNREISRENGQKNSWENGSKYDREMIRQMTENRLELNR